MLPLVSVIVPCRNEAASLERCLLSIVRSNYAPERMEIIVADGMSSDGSREIAGAFAPRVRRIDNLARITPAALNRAIEEARGEYILRVDAHSAIDPEYLGRTVECLEKSDGWCAGGRMRTVTEKRGLIADAIRVVLSHRFGVGNSHFRTISGAGEPREVDAIFNGCWPREVFLHLGGFDERLTRSQDIEFSRRIRAAGGRLLLIPEIESRYFIPGTLRAFLRQSWINGVWAFLPAVRIRHLAPMAFVIAFLAALLAGLATGWTWLPLAVGGPYLAVNLIASLDASMRHRQPLFAFLLPAIFAGLHLTYGAGTVSRAVRLLVSRS